MNFRCKKFVISEYFTFVNNYYKYIRHKNYYNTNVDKGVNIIYKYSSRIYIKYLRQNSRNSLVKNNTRWIGLV